MIPSLLSILDPVTADIIAPPDDMQGRTESHDAPLEAGERGTDLDASLRFSEAYAESLRYCPGIGWLYWDVRRWTSDGAEGHALECAKQSARRWTERCTRSSDENRSARAKDALSLEGGSRIRAAVQLATCDPRFVVKVAQLDRDPWSLNVLNGTLDLRSGQLRPHRRDDLITKIAAVNYVPEAKHPTLMRYLEMVERTTPGMAAFLARCFGAALTGDAETETLFLLQGDGGSGKTTLVEAVAAMLGDYAVKIAFESLCQSKHGRGPGSASPDLVPLRGARLAYASEGDVSARLDAGKVKELTGNEPITARALYQAPMTFLQSWKLWLVSNFDPKADSDDTGIWRRMLKLHFGVIPETLRDPAVKRALVNDPAARSALLTWALAGCIDWQSRSGGRIGLAPPAAVAAATDAYRVKQDTLAEWWADLLADATLSPAAFTASKDLRYHYERWCDENGAAPVFATRFKAYLEAKGLVADRRSSARGWRGIALSK
jgi:putative DNA primase/helicase